MKKVTQLLTLSFALFALFSCGNDDDNVQNNPEEFAQLFKKWEIQSSAADNASGVTSFSVDLNSIESIEFTDDGVFVIVDTAGEVVTGNYTINATDSTLNLEDVGTIRINELSDSNLDFTFELTDETLNLIAQPAEEVATNPANQEMFRLWQVQNLEEFYDQGELELVEDYTKIEILFTTYGTYLVKRELQDGTIELQNSFWKWKNEEQTQACYRLEDEVFNCNEDFFEINSLSDSEFTLTAQPNNPEVNLQYILVPVN